MSSEWETLSSSQFDTALANAQTYIPGANPSINTLTQMTNYNLTDSVLFLAQMCQVAYTMSSYRPEYLTDGIPDVNDATRDVVYEYMSSESDMSHAVYKPLDTSDAHIIFAYKGTDNWYDTLVDINLLMTHENLNLSGFFSTVATYATQVLNTLRDPQGYTVSLTGHSLGGLMALEVFNSLLSQATDAELARIHTVETFNPFTVVTDGYQNLHTVAAEQTPRGAYVRQTVKSHIVNADFASIAMRSAEGGFGTIYVYPNVTPTILSSLVGVNRDTYLNYANHALDNFSAATPAEITSTYQAVSDIGTIYTKKSDDLTGTSPLAETTMQLYLFNPGTGNINPNELYLSQPKLHAEFWNYFNWQITLHDKSGYKMSGLGKIAFPYLVSNNGSGTDGIMFNMFLHQYGVEDNEFQMELYNTSAQRLGYLMVPTGPYKGLDWSTGYISAQINAEVSGLVQDAAIERSIFRLGQKEVEIPAETYWSEGGDDLRRHFGDDFNGRFLPQHNRYYRIRHKHFNQRYITMYYDNNPVEGQALGIVTGSQWQATISNTRGDIFRAHYEESTDTYSFLDFKRFHEYGVTDNEIYLGEGNIMKFDAGGNFESNPNGSIQFHLDADPTGVSADYFGIRSVETEQYLFVHATAWSSGDSHNDGHGSIDPVGYFPLPLNDYSLWTFEEVDDGE